MNILSILSVLFIYVLLLDVGVEGTSRKLSEQEEDLQFEGQLKLLNKPVVKTIHTADGDKYDCVDFYKQTSFDHPSLQNYTHDLHQMKSSPVAHMNGENLFYKNIINTKRNGVNCPAGTVPIRRITKDDLIRERNVSKFRSLIFRQNPDARYAISRTIPSPRRYSGATGSVSLWKPIVSGQQYSAARLILSNGPDSIEVGWRVDPVLYGDDKCRMFVRTTINNLSFFGVRRPGFVVTPSRKPFESVYETVSQRGGPIFEAKFNIARDGGGNWVLHADEQQIGFWPKVIFSNGGLTELASYIEWGGEVFSPNGSPKPSMGSGGILAEDSKLDCLFHAMTWLNEKGDTVIANELETGGDSPDYKIIDEGYQGDQIGQLIVFGGPAGGN